MLDPDAGATTVALTGWDAVEPVTVPAQHATLHLDEPPVTADHDPARGGGPSRGARP